MGSMQVYDILILIIVGWLTLRGAMKGMVSQLASIAGVIASFWAAIRFGPVLEPMLQASFNAPPPWGKVTAMVIAFIGASIVVMFLKRILAGIVNAIHIKKFDRLCGALFGLLKGVLIGMILTFFAVMLSEHTRALATQSNSGKILVRLIQQTQTLFPNDISVLIEANLAGFQKQLGAGNETDNGELTESQTAFSMQNGMTTFINTVTQLTKPLTDSSDPANSPPRLPDELLRKYPNPFISTSNYPPPFDNTTGASETPIVMPQTGASQTVPIPAARMQTDSSPGTNPVAGITPIPVASAPSVMVAPSSDTQPIILNSPPTTLTNSATDWHTLLRDMR